MALVRCACQVACARCTAPTRDAVAVINVVVAAMEVLVVDEVRATAHWAAAGSAVHHPEVCSARAGCCVQGREPDPGVATVIATA